MKTRFMSAVLVALMSLSLLAGCDSSTPNLEQTPQNPPESVSTEQIVTPPTVMVPSSNEVQSPSEDEEEPPEESPSEDKAPEEILPSASEETTSGTELTAAAFDISAVPAYKGNAYVSVNDGQPFFSVSELQPESFEFYSDLDNAGRCGVVYACIGQDIMPTEERGAIGMVKPSGWHTVRYNGLVDGNYLYNRCHLIGYQLSGENANTKNLITGTRYLNTEGMLPIENLVADYVDRTGNHVMYRVTPIFVGSNLLASGVLMEGYSVEDAGRGVCFCVYAYNVQPGVVIDYATGDSMLAETEQTPSVVVTPVIPNPEPETTPELPQEQPPEPPAAEVNYILNTNTKKFHYPSCSSVDDMKEKNKQEFGGTRDEAIAMGYKPCGRCHP